MRRARAGGGARGKRQSGGAGVQGKALAVGAAQDPVQGGAVTEGHRGGGKRGGHVSREWGRPGRDVQGDTLDCWDEGAGSARPSSIRGAVRRAACSIQEGRVAG